MGNVKITTVRQERPIPFSFCFLGNMGGIKVKKTNPNMGDGNIGTGNGGYNYVQVSADFTKISSTIFRLHVWYRVYEDGFNSGIKNRDSLYFDAYKDFDVSTYFTTQNTINVKERWDLQLSESCRQSACYMDYFNGGKSARHGWYPINPNSYPVWKRERDWFPYDKIKIKMDGSGNELTGLGNIGVLGEVYLKIIGVKTIETKMQDESPIISQNYNGSTGCQSVLDFSKEKDLKEVLGHGYDMCEKYAQKQSLREPVLDLEKLNKDKHIVKQTENYKSQTSVNANGSDEYTKKMSSELNVTIKGSIFGATFSNTTKKTSSSSKTETNRYKLITAKWNTIKGIYKTDETDPARLVSYTTANFKNDVADLAKYRNASNWKTKAKYFIEKYGTHVLTGMQTGGSVIYNMSYKQKTTNLSEAKTFSNTTSVSYSSSGQLKGESKSSSSLDLNELVEKIENCKSLEDLKKNLKELLKKSSNKNTSTGGSSGGGWSIEGSVSYSKSSSYDRNTSEEITDISCVAKGGSLMVNPFEDNNATFNNWEASVNGNNAVWCDFLKNRIIPIYEFAQSSYKQVVYDAWLIYCEANDIHCVPVEESESISAINVTGDDTCVKKFKDNKQDWDVCSSKDWPTGWKLTMDLINLKEKEDVALAIRLQVVEGHKNQNKFTEAQLKNSFNYDDVSDTNIVMERVLPFNIPYSAIDTSKVIPHFEAYGVKKGNVGDKWLDITSEIKEAVQQMMTYSDKDNSRKSMIELKAPYKFNIKLDGKGDDRKNLGLSFYLYLPYVKYNN